jgi:epoxyqueuosine reductase
VWALAQLMTRERFDALAAKAMGGEADEDVREEWRRAS